jgi:integrase
MARALTPAAVRRADAFHLTRDTLAYMRGVCEGVPIAEAARRFLGVDHGAEVMTAHRQALDQVATAAQRRGDSRWRLLGLVINDGAPAGVAPSLHDWAEAEGLDGWSQAELQEMYAERFGTPDAGARRRTARNARLRERRLALLKELEAVAIEAAKPSDLLDGWLKPEVAEQLRRGGLLTLADLQRRIAQGGQWWSGLRAFGPVKAKRLAGQVEQLIGKPAATVWPVAIAGQGAGGLSGQHGSNRAVPGACRIDADHDRSAIHAWISARAGSPATAKQYEREAERFLLWCILERKRALADATAEDCRAYMDFIVAVPDRWISRHRVDRMAPGWTPFRGSLSISSQRVALAALHALFTWLVDAGYLASNPWALVNRHLGDDPNIDPEDTDSRAFTPPAWAALQAELERRPPGASVSRLRWICQFVEATGLRSAELLASRRSHLVHRRGAWWLRVHGKGRRNRLVPVPSGALLATKVYFAGRGFELEAAPPEMPLLGALDDAMAPITYASFHETFTRFVRRAVQPLPLDERRQAERASAHWLRHTHATRAAEKLVPPDVLQANLGQSDPRTTARYYRAQLDRRRAEMERVYGVEATVS